MKFLIYLIFLLFNLIYSLDRTTSINNLEKYIKITNTEEEFSNELNNIKLKLNEIDELKLNENNKNEIDELNKVIDNSVRF